MNGYIIEMTILIFLQGMQRRRVTCHILNGFPEMRTLVCAILVTDDLGKPTNKDFLIGTNIVIASASRPVIHSGNGRGQLFKAAGCDVHRSLPQNIWFPNYNFIKISD